jgi:hypothetical protein
MDIHRVSAAARRAAARPAARPRGAGRSARATCRRCASTRPAPRRSRCCSAPRPPAARCGRGGRAPGPSCAAATTLPARTARPRPAPAPSAPGRVSAPPHQPYPFVTDFGIGTLAQAGSPRATAASSALIKEACFGQRCGDERGPAALGQGGRRRRPPGSSRLEEVPTSVLAKPPWRSWALSSAYRSSERGSMHENRAPPACRDCALSHRDGLTTAAVDEAQGFGLEGGGPTRHAARAAMWSAPTE